MLRGAQVGAPAALARRLGWGTAPSLSRALEQMSPGIPDLLCTASHLGPREAQKAPGEDQGCPQGWGHALPAVPLQFFLHPPCRRRQAPGSLASGVQTPACGGVPGICSTWPPVPGTGLTPATLCPCSNGILYQYPDRTDVTPLLSVNMG